VERLAALGDQRRVWGVCMAELRYLKRLYATSTRRGYLSAYRAAVQEQFGDEHPALGFLKLSRYDESAVETGEARRISEQLNNLVEIDADELVRAAVRLLGGTEYAIATGLLLLTGRRPVEILNTGALAPSQARNMVKFSGQAKTRGAASARTEPYDIPVLAKPAMVLGAFEKLRSALDKSDPDRGRCPGRGARRGDYLSYQAARNFADKQGNPARPKDLRAMYAAICYSRFCPRKVSLNAFYSYILGHSELDFGTGLSYLRYYVAGKRGEAVAAEKVAMAGYLEGLKLKSGIRREF